MTSGPETRPVLSLDRSHWSKPPRHLLVHHSIWILVHFESTVIVLTSVVLNESRLCYDLLKWYVVAWVLEAISTCRGWEKRWGSFCLRTPQNSLLLTECYNNDILATNLTQTLTLKPTTSILFIWRGIHLTFIIKTRIFLWLCKIDGFGEGKGLTFTKRCAVD